MVPQNRVGGVKIQPFNLFTDIEITRISFRHIYYHALKLLTGIFTPPPYFGVHSKKVQFSSIQFAVTAAASQKCSQ